MHWLFLLVFSGPIPLRPFGFFLFVYFSLVILFFLMKVFVVTAQKKIDYGDHALMIQSSHTLILVVPTKCATQYINYMILKSLKII